MAQVDSTQHFKSLSRVQVGMHMGKRGMAGGFLYCILVDMVNRTFVTGSFFNHGVPLERYFGALEGV